MEWFIPTTWQLATLATFTLTLASVDIIRRVTRNRIIKRKGCPLPPGPTPLPLIGSALSVNTKEPFRTYTEWREKYGDIMYIRLLDMDVVVLNSPSVASELLEKRSQTYSDRPFMSTVHSFGHDSTFAFANYGEHLKLCRRIFHKTFNSDAVASFHPMQLRKAHRMVLSMVSEPDDYMFHYSTFAAAVTMCSVYDYDPNPKNDPIISIVNEFLGASLPALMPEMAVLLKVFPFLLHIPDWLPGSWIKHQARAARELGAKTLNMPYEQVQKRVQSKEDVNPSMVSDHLAHMEILDGSRRLDYEKALKQTSLSALLGSVETTSSLLTTFTLAMVTNFRVWKRAQAEIDAIVGIDRLPEFGDRSSLPYVDAIMRETMRWQPPVPLGVPHATKTSDIYNGFYIPKGATVFGNIWAMSRDEIRYPDAEQFLPERFIDAEGMLTDDIPDFVFGFGRRVCPGQHTADASLWIAMATMLATFEFNYAKDVDGNDIMFKVEFKNGLARHPVTFPCCITPRSHIRNTFLEQVLTI